MATVMAILLCEKNAKIRMWGYDREQLKQIESAGENKKFLPGYKLPETIVFEPDDERIMAGADLIVSAVPCQFTRRIFKRLKDAEREKASRENQICSVPYWPKACNLKPAFNFLKMNITI